MRRPERIILPCLCTVLCGIPAWAGSIISEEISVSERSIFDTSRPHEYLIDSMDLASLSPHARFLMHPMVTPQLATALRSGKVKTPTKEWRRIVRKASETFGLPEDLIAAVIYTESRFQADAVSPKGAQGAMQIMPGTQKHLGLADPYDAEANVMAGCAYLKDQLVAFGDLDLALAAYNAGPGSVRKYGGIPPYAETMAYVRQVNARRAETAARAQSGNSPKDAKHE